MNMDAHIEEADSQEEAGTSPAPTGPLQNNPSSPNFTNPSQNSPSKQNSKTRKQLWMEDLAYLKRELQELKQEASDIPTQQM